jgi:diguanylate cyclase (GGDEF)-like protein
MRHNAGTIGFSPMKRLVPVFAIVLGWAAAAWAAAPAPLTTLHAVHALSNAEANRALPVLFKATVTYRRNSETTLFVQDGNEAIYVWAKEDIKLSLGDRVLVQGKTQGSFRPIVIAENVTVLNHGSLPQPVPSTFDDLIHARRDCMRVTLRAVILSVNLGMSGTQNNTHIVLLSDGSTLDAYLNSTDVNALKKMLDAEVEISGVASATFDGKMQQTGVSLSVPSLADVKLLKPASASPWSLPITQMDQVFNFHRIKNLSQRVRVHGTITYYQPGSAVVLQDSAKSLWIATWVERPLRVGDEADATGFPEVHNGFLTLNNGEIRESGIFAPIQPKPVTQSQLASSKNLFDLVSIEGQVVMEVREASQDEYVLVVDGQKFSAIYRHPDRGGLPLLPMKQVPLGSKVIVSGICVLETSNPFVDKVAFDILMRSPEDITVVARPSLLTVRNLMLVVGLLLVMMVIVGAKGWSLDRKVRRQTAALAARIEAEAALERRRSHVLENINGSLPLAEILEEIAEMVSFMLHGAPCWCEVSGGARLGDYPKNAGQLHVVRQQIPARSGPALGVLSAGLDPLRPLDANEAEALSTGTRLATLAIETRRLYADLRHRSEFDLLTDIHNRFSLDKHLDALIEEARQNAGIFGLIYIDLDKFKLVNDNYGHQVGDMYLQEVALRMKRQLRSADMLARLGGDEFAVLVPDVRGRAEVEEVAQRLERCMDEPFNIDGSVLRGSASIGVALYPEDGASKDTLLSFADAAMYAVKNIRRHSWQQNIDLAGELKETSE